MSRKECIAMLLAGGQGSRLLALTNNNAKPAVSFGGKYRIIDFSLSNCVNSGIDTVGVLIQYRPLVLNKYLGTGESWDLDSSEGGVHVLPPYATQDGGSWYLGTADSIYHNTDFIDSYDPEYVIILSGDHLYSMDYNKMLEHHKKNNADLTVSVMEVAWEDASRFGIMSENRSGRITRFAEKPAKPESNLASMGIYIFNWSVLKTALIEDHVDADSSHDFGKNIIPKLLSEKKRLFTFHFDGYWKDVGTIDSYYDAQMDLLSDEPEFDIFNKCTNIFSNPGNYPPQKISRDAKVENCIISSGCFIGGDVKNCIISCGAVVETGSVIRDSILLPGCHIGKNSKITKAIVNEDAKVKAGTVVNGGDHVELIV